MMELERGTYWLTRIVFLRSLAFIYNVAFMVALNQNRALIGRRGLLPVRVYLDDLRQRLVRSGDDSVLARLAAAPTLLWFVDLNYVDYYLDLIAYAGLAISFVVLVSGAANMLAMFVLWVLYHSLVNVGQRWYGFGWETQMLETGFLAIWFCPAIAWTQFPSRVTVTWLAVYGLRWMLFRRMFGSGLIKIRGDKCWRKLTCMNYHYETQPVPNPFSYYMHQSPELIHKLEVLGNHVVELIAPFFMFMGRPLAITGGLIQIAFQTILIISGNLSFLNWLTIVPSICCLDDRFLAGLFPQASVDEVAKLQQNEVVEKTVGWFTRHAVNVTVAITIACLSIPVVQNLLSSRQMMNTSFDSLRLVNTYGAFGSITRKRTEVIIQGTHATDPHNPNAEWLEYEFKAKPGPIDRRPVWISPYHHRLDWLMWFSAFQSYQHNPWLVHLVARLLRNDPLITDLLRHNPFAGGPPPKFVRLEHYAYAYTKIGSEEARRGEWYTRRRMDEYMPPVRYESLVGILRQMGWVDPDDSEGEVQEAVEPSVD